MKGLFDTHTHTQYSHDSKANPNEICQKAIEYGLAGVTITDHADVELEFDGAFPMLMQSVECARKLKVEYEGRLKVMVGVEMGYSHDSFALSQDFLARLGELDQVIYSVHCIDYKGQMSAYSRENFSEFSPQEIDEYIKKYFDSVLECVKRADADILPHLTCPVKYFAKQGITLDLSKNEQVIDEIIKLAIEKGMAFELNSSSPAENEVFERYLAFGGKTITLGGDAHIPSAVGAKFDKWVELLKSKGISEVYYFENRKKQSVKI